MKIYQVLLLLLLLPLTSNSQACDVCAVGHFNPDKQINATFTCGDHPLLPGDREDVIVDECAYLQNGFLMIGCCFGDSNEDCSICGDGALTNPEFIFDIDDPETAETESTTCGEYDTHLAALGTHGLCGQSPDQALLLLGCQCEEGSPAEDDDDSPAAHANVKIASLVVVGATFMASFFF
jgi:hypothetical protein